MRTKQQLALEKMSSFGGFQCPFCGAPLFVKESSLCCEKGHTYDVARKGYVHLHHKTVQSPYDKDLFDARRAVFEAGFYQPVADVLKTLLAPSCPETLLDAGCGEGYYLTSLSPSLPKTLLVGIDLSKEAILSAAGRESTALYCVGDLNRLPFADHVFDVLLNILSPASYSSFTRVLKKDGCLIKIMPGKEYLQEIRNRLPKAEAVYDDTRVPEYLQQHMFVLHLERLHYTLPLTPKEYACFVAMTPLTESLSGDERNALLSHPPDKITIDLQVAVCRAAS
jgi:23S rRNA (guanine745-N1)-methyltransferase